jgi:hypothetical protein
VKDEAVGKQVVVFDDLALLGSIISVMTLPPNASH